jgi:LemA protein
MYLREEMGLMKKTLIIVGIILAILIIPIVMAVGSYNSLVQLDENVDAQWAQVLNQLKRRTDLIPNLVNTVQGFADQERDVLIGVTEARSRLENSNSPEEAAEANAQLTNALSSLNVVVERYPELKSNENFIRLQDELAGTENRISVARRDYNQSAQDLNSRVRRFPTNIFANIFGFETREYFEVSEEDQEVPEVNF